MTPAPLRVVVVNAMSVSTHPAHARRILRAAAEHADLILGSECSDLNGAAVLGPDWRVWQDTSSTARAGSLVAVRANRGTLADCRIRLGVARQPARTVRGKFIPGDTMRDRWLLTARVTIDPGTLAEWSFKALAGHAPPKRLWRRWPAFMAAVRRQHADVAGADWNKLARAVMPALGRRVRAVRLLGVAVRRGIPVSRSRSLDVGGDHKAVAVTLFPKEKP